MIAANALRRGANPSTYSGENKVPAIILLWFVLVAIAVARNGGKVPDQKHVIALGVATLILAGVASLAPRVVFYVLLAGVLVVAFQNSDLVANYIDKGTAAVRGAVTSA